MGRFRHVELFFRLKNQELLTAKQAEAKTRVGDVTGISIVHESHPYDWYNKECGKRRRHSAGGTSLHGFVLDGPFLADFGQILLRVFGDHP